MKFDREIYFDTIKNSLFKKFTQQQVDGQEAILAAWEQGPRVSDDLRWLAYPLATTFHETAQKCWPIEEYQGAQQSYGKEDPETHQCYYGRGFVQLTHRENYARATEELGLKGTLDLEWHAAEALDLGIASAVMFRGMEQGWFRGDSKGRHTLDRYFNTTVDDAYGAREIINGDKKTIPSWSNGVSIGNLIKDYHKKFLTALEASLIEGEEISAESGPVVRIVVPKGTIVVVEEV